MVPLTVEDYRLLPEAGPRYQLVDARLIHISKAETFSNNL